MLTTLVLIPARGRKEKQKGLDAVSWQSTPKEMKYGSQWPTFVKKGESLLAKGEWEMCLHAHLGKQPVFAEYDFPVHSLD